jgi:hypothetical protein
MDDVEASLTKWNNLRSDNHEEPHGIGKLSTMIINKGAQDQEGGGILSEEKRKDN